MEHDWKFNFNLNTQSIVKAFDDNPKIGYLRFGKFDITNEFASQRKTSVNWDILFEPENELNCDIPLTKVSFYSGNPHMCRISKCKDLYISKMLDLSEKLYHEGGNN